MIGRTDRKVTRRKRHLRVRRRVKGTAERPRLSVFRSLNNIYAQVIDDDLGVTLVSASSLDPDLVGEKSGGNVAGAEQVGQLLAERALEKGVSRVVFDRGGYKYHGRVAALADAARKAGLEF